MALEVASVLEVAVAGEEMVMVVLREVVVMVLARPQTQTQTHSLSHPSDVPRRNHRRLMAAAVVWLGMVLGIGCE